MASAVSGCSFESLDAPGSSEESSESLLGCVTEDPRTDVEVTLGVDLVVVVAAFVVVEEVGSSIHHSGRLSNKNSVKMSGRREQHEARNAPNPPPCRGRPKVFRDESPPWTGIIRTMTEFRQFLLLVVLVGRSSFERNRCCLESCTPFRKSNRSHVSGWTGVPPGLRSIDRGSQKGRKVVHGEVQGKGGLLRPVIDAQTSSCR